MVKQSITGGKCFDEFGLPTAYTKCIYCKLSCLEVTLENPSKNFEQITFRINDARKMTIKLNPSRKILTLVSGKSRKKFELNNDDRKKLIKILDKITPLHYAKFNVKPC